MIACIVQIRTIFRLLSINITILERKVTNINIIIKCNNETYILQ